jgi:hypothetical protein
MKILLVALLAIGTIVSAKHIVQEKQYFKPAATTTTTARTTTTTRATTTTTKPSTTTTEITTTTEEPTTTHEPVQAANSCEGAKTLTPMGKELDLLLRVPMDLPPEFESYRGMIEMVVGPVFPFTIPEETIESVCWTKSTCPDSIVPSEIGKFLETFVPTYCESFWTPVTKTEMSDKVEEALVEGYVQITTDPQGAMTEIAGVIDTNYGPQIAEYIAQVDAEIDAFMLPYVPVMQMVGPVMAPTLAEMGEKLTEETLFGVMNGLMTGAIPMDDPMAIPNFCFGEELVQKFTMQAGMAVGAFTAMGMGK